MANTSEVFASFRKKWVTSAPLHVQGTEAEAQHQEQQKRIQARREDAEMQLQAIK